MLRAKVNGKVRNVSPAMARRLRAKGIAVEGAGQAPVVAPPAPPPPQVKKLDEVLPPALPATIKVAMPADRREIVDDSRQALATLTKAPRLEKVIGQLGSQPAFDLTDEELERLTAPDGGEG